MSLVDDPIKVLFRVDASKSIGYGHFIRSYTLAKKISNLFDRVEIIFCCKDLPSELIRMLHVENFLHINIPSTKISNTLQKNISTMWLMADQYADACEVKEALDCESVDWLVIDHYGLGVTWEKEFLGFANRILVIDDLENREHICDILLDQNIAENPEAKYCSLVPINSLKLLGPRYAILRDDFIITENRAIKSATAKKSVFVFLVVQMKKII